MSMSRAVRAPPCCGVWKAAHLIVRIPGIPAVCKPQQSLQKLWSASCWSLLGPLAESLQP